MHLLGLIVSISMREIGFIWFVYLVNIFSTKEYLEICEVQTDILFDNAIHMGNIFGLNNLLIELLVHKRYLHDRVFLLLGLASVVILKLEILGQNISNIIQIIMHQKLEFFNAVKLILTILKAFIF